MKSDEICNPSVAVSWRELLALARIGTMGTVSPPTKSELEDLRVLRELQAKVEKPLAKPTLPRPPNSSKGETK